MLAKGKNNLLHLGILIFVGVVFVSLILSLIKSSQQQTIPQAKIDRYESSTLSFSIEVPEIFKLNDTGITVMLLNKDGKIEIARNGTQFSDLRGYLSDSDNKSDIVVEQEESKKLNGYEGISRFEYPASDRQAKYKIYFIFINNYVYTLSTSSKALYADLDQIAQSFRYTP